MGKLKENAVPIVVVGSLIATILWLRKRNQSYYVGKIQAKSIQDTATYLPPDIAYVPPEDTATYLLPPEDTTTTARGQPQCPPGMKWDGQVCLDKTVAKKAAKAKAKAKKKAEKKLAKKAARKAAKARRS